MILWHNPRCSKSRAALSILKERQLQFEVRLYLKDSPSRAELNALHQALGCPPAIDMMRTGEAQFRRSGLDKQDEKDVLLDAMVQHPILIERPILQVDERAIIGRPPEAILALL